MVDIAASVLTRLKNKVQASGRSYQLCLQLFCQEEFLRRLEKSKGTVFEIIPLIGTISRFGGLSDFADEKVYYEQIKKIYGVKK